jgi:hypothetical protein
MSRELTEEEVDAIWEDAKDAAINAWGPLGAPNCRQNPHPLGTVKADVWDHAFRDAYARENGY